MEKNRLLSLYRIAFESRVLDEELQKWHFKTGGGFLFPNTGAEIGATAITLFLRKEDALIPHYRGYSSVIGKGLPVEKIIGEVMRSSTGAAKGMGDACTFRDPALGMPGHSIILGANLGIALGLAYAISRGTSKNIVTVVFGDGEASRGAFGSALNIAAIWHLPLFFVCLNNGISLSTSIADTSSTATIAEKAAGYAVRAITVHDTDPVSLLSSAGDLISEIREKSAPALLEITEKRYVPHTAEYLSEPFLGDHIPTGNDPLQILRKKLLESGLAEKNIHETELGARNKVRAGFTNASEARMADEKDFFAIYHE